MRSWAAASATGRSNTKLRRSPLTMYCRAGKVTVRPPLLRRSHTARRGAGLSNDELTASREARAVDPKAAAALKFARAVVERRGDVRDRDLADVRAAGYADGDIAEIIAHVALNVFTNYFNRAAHTEIDFPLVTAGQLA